AARKTFRPIRPNPLIPTRTGIRFPSFLVGEQKTPTDAGAAHRLPKRYLTPADDFDAQIVRITQVGGVVTGAVLRPGARWPVVGAALGQPCRMGSVDGRLPARLERHVGITRAWRSAPDHDPE